MRFKKIFSCILVASLINSNFINAMRRTRDILSLEDRKQIGGNKITSLREKTVQVIESRKQNDVPVSESHMRVEMTGPFNSNFINAMPRRILSLEEREEIGWNKIKSLQEKIVQVTEARKQSEVPFAESYMMVEMTGPFMEKFVINQEMAQRLLSIDPFGDVVKKNKNGMSVVEELGSVFFKTDGRHFNPEQPMLSPAMENAAYWFYHIIFGEGATPSTLIILNNVAIKRPPEVVPDNKLLDLAKSYKNCRENRRGFSYFKEESKKKNTPPALLEQFIGLFKPKFENFIAQASEGVEGVDLNDFIKSIANNPERFHTLSTKSLSIHFLTSLLLNLSDAKGDNFRVSTNGEIIGIDNDRFLAPDIFKQCPHPEHDPTSCKEAFHQPGVRSVFYAWRNIRNMSLDKDVQSLLSNTNFLAAMRKWLNKLSMYDTEYIRLKEHGALGGEFFELQPLEKIDSGTQSFIKAGLVMHSPTFPLNLYKNSITEIMRKFTELSNLLNHYEDITHKDIIASIQYYVNLFYETALAKDSTNSLDNILKVISSNTLVGVMISDKYYCYENLNLKLPPNIISKLCSTRTPVSIEGSILELRTITSTASTSTLVESQEYNERGRLERLKVILKSPPLLLAILGIPIAFLYRYYTNVNTEGKFTPIIDNGGTWYKLDTPIPYKNTKDELDKPVNEIPIDSMDTPTLTKDTNNELDKPVNQSPLDNVDTPLISNSDTKNEMNQDVDDKSITKDKLATSILDKDKKDGINKPIVDESMEELEKPFDFSGIKESWDKIENSCAKLILSRSNLTDLYSNSNSSKDQENKIFSSIAKLEVLDLSKSKQNNNLCKIGNNELKFISHLTNLTKLDLSFNRIGDEDTKSLSSLYNLTFLDLSNNQIGEEGAVYLSFLSNLSYINLRENKIGNKGAKSLAAITNLTFLDLHSNQIGDEGAKFLSYLSRLTYIDLGKNKIEYAGAKSLSFLYNLTSLDLSINQIGDLELKSLTSLSKLTFLDLHSNQIGDTGAVFLSFLPNLTYLDLSENKIGDRGVSFLSSLTNLTALNLTNSKKVKYWPISLFLPNLIIPKSWKDQISNDGAKSLSSLINLTSLDLSANQIEAEGARYLSSLTNLISLDLSSNQIEADGSRYLSSLTNLTSLALISNQIGDEGAKSLSSLSNLTSINLCLNKIGDEGTKSLSSLSNLTFINLRSNKIYDEGANSLTSLANLNFLDLSENYIKDEGAKSISSLSNLTELNLHYNQIRDEGANSLISLTNLIYLDLSENHIKDEGARSISSLSNLTELNLHYNQIRDEGANSLTSLTNLTYLDLSENHIGDAGATSISSLTNLTYLNLRLNQIGDEGANSLIYLTNLTYLNLFRSKIRYDIKNKLIKMGIKELYL